jgi:hypothetical protein
MTRRILILAAAMVVLVGCAEPPPRARRVLPAVASEQRRAYDETVTGMFLSLVDFETDADGREGFAQADWFRLVNPGPGDGAKFVVNMTSTGAGALQADLSPGSALVLDVPGVTDLSDYTLLSMAVHSETLRDDFRVTLETDAGIHRSGGHLLRPGWNMVHVDLQRLRRRRGVDLTGVRRIRWDFPRAAGPLRIRLDDVLLIDNDRVIRPTPPGVILRKSGLDWTIQLPGRDEPMRLSQGDDGLWRLGDVQTNLTLRDPDGNAPADPLTMLGERSLGEVQLLETNRVRTRLAVTWFFPSRAGEWASLAVRRVRWEHTFYADGRWVTHMEINNAGGQPIGAVRIDARRPVAWSNGAVAAEMEQEFAGPVGRWNWMAAGDTRFARAYRRQYARPGRIETTLGGEPTTADANGYDVSQGCHVVRGRDGLCRFELIPPPEGLVNPVVRVENIGPGEITAAAEGLAIRTWASSADGEVVLVIPGEVHKPLSVEFRGPAAE